MQETLGSCGHATIILRVKKQEEKKKNTIKASERKNWERFNRQQMSVMKDEAIEWQNAVA